jgi:DNA invertase Pin-like site-specific DNA recombinase
VRAFLYARVSTVDKDQNPEVQLSELRAYCQRREWVVAGEFVDQMSGSKSQRPQWQEMLRRARRRECDAVVVFRFNRFARSTKDLVNWLEEFAALGVEFVSLHESIDTSTPMGKLIFKITAAIAEFELDMLKENVRAGLQHARSKGKILGRPRRIGNGEKIMSLRKEGWPWEKISRKYGLSVSTAKRLARKATVIGQKRASKRPANRTKANK